MKRARSGEISRSGFIPAKKQRAFLAQPLNQTQKKQVQRAITSNEEVKWVNVSGSSTAVPLTGVTSVLSIPAQGQTSTTRVGDKIKLIKCWIDWSLIVADSTNVVRVILWQYKENTVLQTPTLANILDIGPSGAVPEVWSAYNDFRKDHFKILVDKSYDLNGVSVPFITRRWRVPITSLNKVQFNVGATTGYNHLCLSFISDSVAVSHPATTYMARTYFTDA